MNELELLVEKLKVLEKSIDGFSKAIKEVALYLKEKTNSDDEEITILLANKDRTFLSFAYPEYLVNAGTIPVNSIDSIPANIYRKGSYFLENNVHKIKHLAIFELIKTPQKKVLPIFKMMGMVIPADNDKIGVIEVSRRSTEFETSGPDFTDLDLSMLNKLVKEIGPLLKKLMPEDYTAKMK